MCYKAVQFLLSEPHGTTECSDDTAIVLKDGLVFTATLLSQNVPGYDALFYGCYNHFFLLNIGFNYYVYVKGVARGDKLKDNNPMTLKLP